MIVLLLPVLLFQITHAETDFNALHRGIVQIHTPISNQPLTLNGTHYPLLGAPDEEAFSYYGIRYGVAQRFEHSTFNDDFEYLKNNERPLQGNVCPISYFPGAIHTTKSMSEDCLYLDVFVPPVSKDISQLFPVLMYMHGGGFIRGDKDVYNSTLLAADIRAVVVTINYRHGIIGFMSTLDDAAPGNYGIGDAKLALSWIQKYISAFGGDSNQITIFGESAGGIMTSLLFLDENIRRNVKAAVAMSGSAFTPYALHDYKATQMAELQAMDLDCWSKNTTVMIKCMKELPLEKFLVDRLSTTHYLDETKFGPVIDGIHIKADPAETIPANELESGTEGTYIIGYTKDEGAQYEPTMTNATVFDIPSLRTETATLFPWMRNCPADPTHISLIDQVMAYYNVTPSDSRLTLLKKLQIIFADLWIKYPTTKESFLYKSRKHSEQVPNYQYLISYGTKYLDMGAFHGVDVNLLFRGIGFEYVPKESYSWQAQVAMKNFIRDVAYNGKPNGPVFNENQTMLHLDKDAEWVTTKAESQDFMDLWEKMFGYKCPQPYLTFPTTDKPVVTVAEQQSTVDSGSNQGNGASTTYFQAAALFTLSLFLSFI